MLASCTGQFGISILGLVQSVLDGQSYEMSDTPSDPVVITSYSELELPAEVAGDAVVRYSGYVSSYNQQTLIPDWVAYELTASETDGDEQRGDRQFSMDKRVKGRQAMREDYYDSGWTKGHMAPASDFRWSETAMDETFYFTNVCPQNEHLNSKDWEYLERQVRGWADRFGKVWVVTGPIIGTNRYGRIGERGVVVPDSFFKAVMACKNGKYHSIAFIMDNDNDRYWLNECAVSVNDVERITGLDLYPVLDDSLEESVEDQVSLSFWGIN